MNPPTSISHQHRIGIRSGPPALSRMLNRRSATGPRPGGAVVPRAVSAGRSWLAGGDARAARRRRWCCASG